MIDVLHNFWFLVAVTIIVCSVTATIAQAWQKVRRAEQELVLKQEMLRRGLSVDEMERLLRANSKPKDNVEVATDEKFIEDLVTCLAENGASGRVVEQVLAAVRSADPARLRPLCRAIKAVLENSSLEEEEKDEQMLAVVRGLCVPNPPAVHEEVPAIPPSGAARTEETFQPVRPV
jgi:hypothetical protein